ncbi:MAG TPA: NAD-dependent epimerase/dehydratase family protein [Bacteroidales bacterium]|nr:NAD-dependent epimerase/dehydratase family protein [Bacteroidales bacterium]HNR43178.1 NAD-dependent epimerase/dehydratase family protein [Bacteroidales bacterium]HPM18394.1 NAD-dependent epimerase/dehydratase family protein [Bacteroidales bacterium]
MAKYLITGTAGFIGYHIAKRLIGHGNEIVGIDNVNDYYDVNLKFARLEDTGIMRDEVSGKELIRSRKSGEYRFKKMNLEDNDSLLALFRDEKFDYVIHLAAQAGVRYSIENPGVYISSNITGTFNILEACRHYPVKFLMYASSSSVYGNSEKVPFSEDDNVDSPVSLYAATKKSNELMAASYNHLYGIESTGLRFFTVYGPWGRPDMAIFKFTRAILNNEPLQVFAGGRLLRDFTYIDDIVNGMTAILKQQTVSAAPSVMNIGNNSPVTVSSLISELEECLGRKAIINYLPMQQGDVKATYASISRIGEYCGFAPRTDLKAGLSKFCRWYLDYYGIR